MADRASRLVLIDVLRGLAALAVVLRHVQERFFPVGLPGPAQTIFEWFGTWGVALFFVLSGFCIHMPHARARSLDPGRRLDRGAYLQQRFWRIAPPYWVALALAVVVGASMPTGVLPGASGLGDVAAHALFVHNLSPATIYSVEGPFWTIAVEAQFYLLYLLICDRPLRPWLVGMLLGAGLAIYAAASVAVPATSPWRGTIQHFTAVSFWQWFLGAWLAQLYVTTPAWTLGRTILLGLRGVALLSSIAISLVDPVVAGAHLNVWALPFLCGAVVWLFAAEAPLTPQRHGPLAALGEASYSLYLLHPVAIALIAFAAASTGASVVVAVSAALALSIAMAFASFRFVERPAMRLRSVFGGRPRAPRRRRALAGAD